MKLTTMSLALAASFAALAPTSAHADIAGDRVLLVVGPTWGCPTGQAAFRRIHQSPDGGETQENGEFQVPAGKYLEITNIEYSPPSSYHDTSYVQSVSLILRKRIGTGATSLFDFTYSNAPIFDAIANDVFASAVHQYTSPGAETHVATFPAGPLVSNQARLCLNAPSNFYNASTRFKIRGRLIAADPTALPPGGGGTLP